MLNARLVSKDDPDYVTLRRKLFGKHYKDITKDLLKQPNDFVHDFVVIQDVTSTQITCWVIFTQKMFPIDMTTTMEVHLTPYGDEMKVDLKECYQAAMAVLQLH